MVMLGIGWMAVPPFTYYELSIYDMSTHNKIILMMASGRGVLGANTSPGFAFAWLWRCCFGLAGFAEFCPDSGYGTGCATVEAAVGAV